LGVLQKIAPALNARPIKLLAPMELLSLLALIAIGLFALKTKDQKQRIALLASHLGKYRVEALMKDLTEGYSRALGEKDTERQAQVWNLQTTTEAELCSQFSRFVAEFAKVDTVQARVSKLPWPIPFATLLFPAATFDMRKALSIHAHGLNNAQQNSGGQSAKGKAFALSAEMLLMQHTCHWFCRSRTTASARMMVRNQTSYAQLVAAVSPGSRAAYSALVGLVPQGPGR
jgi:hypothetical protein